MTKLMTELLGRYSAGDNPDYLVCDGGNPVSAEDDPCDVEDCQSCCTHDDRDHGICLYCGDEEDPGLAIDRVVDYMEDR